MQSKSMRKSAGFLLTMCLSLGLLASPALAKPQGAASNNQTMQQTKQVNNHQFDQYESRKEIVRKVQNVTGYSFDRGHEAGMTLRDFIITLEIAQHFGDRDFVDIYMMQKNGSPYKEICKANGINWGSVRRHVKNQHQVMSDEARELGIIMWALDEILH